MHKRFLTGICLLLALSSVVLAGCVAVEKAEPPASMTGRNITISTGTQGGVPYNLTIGLVNIRKQNYVDAEGKTVRRLEGTLLLYTYDPRVEKSIGVYVGQTLAFEQYVIYVKEIASNGVAGHVTLIVQELSQASAHQ